MIRDILLHMKENEEWSPHCDVTIALGRHFKARVTGLLTHQGVALAKKMAPGPGIAAAAGSEYLESLQRDADAVSARVRARFEAAIARAGIEGVFEDAEGRASDLLALVGRFHDLVVVEQTDPQRDEANWLSVEEAAVSCGRPTLIVPRTIDVHAPIGRRILIAWNGGRQATRALHGALPFVEEADSVVLLRGEGREGWPSITKAPKLDIVDYLSRHARQVDHAGHGVVDSSAADIILDSARAFGCDMIVMGAFGREGLARMLFGGATSHVLARASVPVLAAH